MPGDGSETEQQGGKHVGSDVNRASIVQGWGEERTNGA